MGTTTFVWDPVFEWMVLGIVPLARTVLLVEKHWRTESYTAIDL